MSDISAGFLAIGTYSGRSIPDEEDVIYDDNRDSGAEQPARALPALITDVSRSEYPGLQILREGRDDDDDGRRRSRKRLTSSP